MAGLPIPAVENAIPSVLTSANGTVIHMILTASDIEEVIDAGFVKLSLERSTNSGLSWEEAHPKDARVVLERDKTVYDLYDRLGSVSYLYRARYVDKDGKLGDFTDSIVGSGLAIREVLTVADLKQRYFFGIPFTDDQGNPLPDAVWQHYIVQAIRWFEHQIDIPLLPTTILNEAHDYDARDYQAFSFIRLDNYPVASVEAFRVEYPSGQSIVQYPSEWLRLSKEEGHLQIVPSAGTLSQVLIGQGGSFLPAVYGGLDYLPQLFHVDYTAGFELGKIPRNIVDLIGMFAALGPFNIFGDLITGAGIGNLSLSMDGLSQSITTTQSAMYGGYGSRTSQYEKQIREQIPMLRRYYKGIRMVVA